MRFSFLDGANVSMGQKAVTRDADGKDSKFMMACVCLFGVAYSYWGKMTFLFAGFDIYYSLLISAAAILFAMLAFLVKPRFARIQALFKQAGIILLPAVFPFVYSMMLWIASGASDVTIRKGLVSVAYSAGGICMMAAFVYMAGEKAAWCYLISLIIANMITMAEVIMKGGAAAFFRELAALLVSFSEDTGPLMKQMEIHDITYGIGCYLVYYGLWARSERRHFRIVLLSLFFFFMGLKRIAVAGVLFAIMAGYFLCWLGAHRQWRDFLLKAVGTLFLVFVLFYIGASYHGLYGYLERIGLDTKGRDEIYRIYSQYYDFSPAYMGRGMGWVEAQRDYWREIEYVITAHTHNSYVQEYIELGMLGFILWCWLRCHCQVSYSFQSLGDEGGVLAFSMIAYMAVTYMTDITVNSYPVNNAFAILLMSFGLSGREHVCNSRMEMENRRRSEGISMNKDMA